MSSLGLSCAVLLVRTGRSGADLCHPTGSVLIGPLKRFARCCTALADAMASATGYNCKRWAWVKESFCNRDGPWGPTPSPKKRGWCRTQLANNKTGQT